MTKIATRTVPEQQTVAGAGEFRAPNLDPAVIDFYLRRGRQERARAIREMIRGVFSRHDHGPGAEVHELPARRRAAAEDGCADCTDRAA